MEILNLKNDYLKMTQDINRYNESLDSELEISKIVFNNDWVRIYLQANPKEKLVILQVEVFPNTDLFKKNLDPKLILTDQILYLQYLQSLLDLDFSLGFIQEEGIWFCHKKLLDEPSFDFEEKLNPMIYFNKK